MTFMFCFQIRPKSGIIMFDFTVTYVVKRFCNNQVAKNDTSDKIKPDQLGAFWKVTTIFLAKLGTWGFNLLLLVCWVVVTVTKYTYLCVYNRIDQAGLLPQKVHCLAATKSPFCPLYTHNYATLLATHEIGNDFRAFATISASLCYAMLDYSLSTTYLLF